MKCITIKSSSARNRVSEIINSIKKVYPISIHHIRCVKNACLHKSTTFAALLELCGSVGSFVYSVNLQIITKFNTLIEIL